MYTLKKEIRYDAERDNNFADEIKAMPGCEHLDQCIQCGTCSGTCPLSIYMDLTPRRVIHLTRAGFKDEVMRCNAIWLCSSCYSCHVECPKNIGITDIMYAIKTKAVEAKKYPKGFPVPVLASVFYNMVKKNGRITESHLVVHLFLRTSLMRLIGMSKLGWDLVRTRRMKLGREKMDDPRNIAVLLDAVEGANVGSRQ